MFQYPWEIMKKAHALGLMNGHIPQEYGMELGKNTCILRIINHPKN